MLMGRLANQNTLIPVRVLLRSFYCTSTANQIPRQRVLANKSGKVQTLGCT